MVISLDTETVGLDIWSRGVKPFFVTMCNEEGEQRYWEWDVDPLTREPIIPKSEVMEIYNILLEESEDIVLQNSKFDIGTLSQVDIRFKNNWDWSRTHDTLIGGHLLGSNQPHDLTSMGIQYLGVDIQKYEDALQDACNAARRLARKKFKTWRIAKQGMEEMPSAKAKCWKMDTWLPRAIAKHEKYSKNHPWWTVLSDYANADSAVTLPLWLVMEKKIKARGLWEIYLERMKAMKIAFQMEAKGLTTIGANHSQLKEEYQEESDHCEDVCLGIAKSFGYDLEMPKGGGRNDSLAEFIFNVLGLEKRRGKKSKTDAPTLDAEAMEYYATTLREGSKERLFIKSLLGKRARDKSLQALNGYEKFWHSLTVNGIPEGGFYLLHPSLNPCGTNTLRWSSNNPNSQNISKKGVDIRCKACNGDGCKRCDNTGMQAMNTRYCFGPAPGREWWSLDAKNIELRIPAYESGETDFINLFERENDPPYFGSNHLLVSHVLHPKLFEECVNDKGELDGRIFKKRYAATWYQWVKNGNFATLYGAVDKADGTGTADRAYHMPGAQAKIKARFKKMEELNQYWIRFANKHGYVETIPDRSVNPNRGYPILCTRTDYGRILETVPLNYHTQSTAMFWTHRGMVRVSEFFESLNRGDKFQGRKWPGGYYLAMQVHDELVPDMPSGKGKGEKPYEYNLPIVRECQRLMSLAGEDIGIPTPVGCEFHEFNWSEGVTL